MKQHSVIGAVVKKTALVVCILILLLAGILQIPSLARANPELLYFKPGYCNISIQSPQTRSHNSESIPLNFTVETNYELDANSCHYMLDGQDNDTGVKVEGLQIVGEELISDELMPDINTTYFPYTEYTFLGQILLNNLSHGKHSLTITLQSSEGNIVALETAAFTIPNESEPFPISIVIVSATVVAIVVIGLFVYSKKRKMK